MPVTARRGSLLVTVEQIVAEGTSYRLLLDPFIAQGPEGAGTGKLPQA
jgi:hypothetical protein